MVTRRIWAATLSAVMLLAVLVPFSLTSRSDSAQALTGSEFRAGNIISDDNFYFGSAMSESQIQAFLDSRGSACEAGYTCLRDYAQTTYSRTADKMCAAYSGGSNESAARIIAKVARACNISPKVLLVMLEKEQSLVTSAKPTVARYNIAMGYACPDTAPCDAQYFGFYNQVYKSAWQLQRYGNPPGTTASFTWFGVGKTSKIGYHPDAACGSAPVFIENKATAALYYYTPYQPNAAALGNLYGTGDSCSAYGNRNFWRLYNTWFGSPTVSLNGSVDSVVGGYKSIAISGWALDPSTKASTYIWVNVDGVGGPAKADVPLSWFDAAYPGYGPNHGFSLSLPATPGAHEVCVYRDQALIGCQSVVVPQGVGHLDSAVGVVGGVKVAGWSVDSLRTDSSFVWVNVDGVGGAHRTNRSFSWLNTMFPGAGAGHGFDLTVWASPGKHEVCVHGPDNVVGCETVTVPTGTGSFDSATAAPGGVQVKGWSVDGNRPDSSFIWANVDGVGGPYRTNSSLSWLPNHLPGFGPGNGFDLKLPAKKGKHEVCIYGADSLFLGCNNVTVLKSADGYVDTVTAVPGGIRTTGWSVDLTTSASAYIWINVNGTGGPYKANKTLSWFEGLYPGSGLDHGFDVTIPKPPGTYEVCVHGSEDLLTCKNVTVR